MLGSLSIAVGTALGASVHGIDLVSAVIYAVIAGGLHLTREQMKTSPDLAHKKGGSSGNPEDDLPTRDVIRADF
mgnify:CR=1 FL=1